MTDAAHRYHALTERWLRARDGGSMTEQEEDAILDELDELWWEMTDEEREARNSYEAPPEVGG